VRLDIGGSASRSASLGSRDGAKIIPPYDDPDIIAGQGTASLEILEDLEEAHAVIVPVGGGAA